MKLSLNSLRRGLIGSLLLVLLLLFSAAAVANDCLMEIFRSSYDSPEVYVCNFCFINAGELARSVSAITGENAVRVEDLNLLVIRHKKVDLANLNETPAEHALMGLAARGKKLLTDGSFATALWSYHAILEYRGQILDLDLEDGPRLMDKQIYFERMFPETPGTVRHLDSVDPRWRAGRRVKFNAPKNTLVTVFPAVEYFKHFVDYRPVRVPDLAFIQSYPTSTLDRFLAAVRP